jgi:hypothetical protein
MLMVFKTRSLCIGAAAGVAVLGATLVSAQQVPEKNREPFARDKGSDSKELRGPPGARQDSGSDQRGDRPSTGGAKPGAQGPDGLDKGRPKGAERFDKDRPKGAERPDGDKDRRNAAERPDKDRPKAVERPDKDGAKGAESTDRDRPKGAERPDKDRPKGAERPDKDRPKGAEGPDKDRPKAAESPEQGRSKGTRLSERQRSEVGAKLRQGRVDKTRVQVSLAVGSRIPRSIRLHPLPGAVLAVVPGYRGYSYFVREDDTIVIVDARTYVIVDVIPAAIETAAALRLSPEQMRFILATVPKDRTADVRLRLALGAEVPAHVELLRFPAEVRAQVPEVEGYRYIVVDGDVVIVDPRNRDIALVISE